ncbi:MAG: hypothetical protein AAFQ05_01050, partial [Pseudomonadota bacterium]
MTYAQPPTKPPITESFETSAQASSRPTLQFDWTEWLPYLDALDGTEEQKRLVIEQVWQIVLAFADLGWEIKGANQITASETSGQVTDLTAALRAAVLHSEDTH